MFNSSSVVKDSLMNINDLCDIEISIIASMFQSREHFLEIINTISTEDFTFFVTKKIFEHLRAYVNEVDFFNKKDEKFNIANDLYYFENILEATTLRILDSKPSIDIDLDLVELVHFSSKRQTIFEQSTHEHKQYGNISIEDEFGQYSAVYCHGIIKEIFTSYLFHLPEELCDTFKDTFEKIIPFAQQENFRLTMEVNENDPQDIRAFVLRKNLTQIDKIQSLIEWGKLNHLEHGLFPKNRGYLQNSLYIELDNMNIESLPDEFCEVLSKIKFLSLLHNKITHIPKNICLLKNCVFLGLCDNKIKFLPDSLFQLTKLSTLCLHGNMLEEIPDEIMNIVELKRLTISNNPIKNLPSTFRKLTNLKELDIENTLLDESSLHHINLENIEKICFDDKFLPYFIQNFHLLKNINFINLNHSEYTIEHPIFNSVNLNIMTENWMEEKDYKGNGCIMLKKIS